MTVASVSRTPDIETIAAPDDFAPLAREWDALVRAMPRPSPFLLHGWLACWWQTYGRGARLAIHVARRDGRLVAASATVRALAPGSVRRELPRRQTCRSRRSSRRTGRAVGGRGRDREVHRWLGPRLRGSLRAAEDKSARPRARTDLDVIERVESPVLELGEDWNVAYRAKTSSKTRNLHRRRRRQLGELGRLEVAVAREPDELVAALEDAFRIHDLRWEGRPDGSEFTATLGKQFHRDAILALAVADVPRIVLLRLDGRAIAFHYYFALEGRMYVHRLGFDPAFARYSPGLVNTLDTIETASAEGLTRVEFLGGAERYKLELADRFDPLCHGLGLARGPISRAAVEARLAYIRLRLRLKRHHGLRQLYVDGVAPARRLAARARKAL